MNTENTSKRRGKLEQLSEEMQTGIIEITMNSTLTNAVLALQKRGIDVSVPTLSRYVRKHREKLLMEEGEEMKGTVGALAARGKESAFRVGTLEAVRQRLYDRALLSNSPEEARQLYAAMVKEEAKLQELELERRRLGIAEEELKLKALKARAELGIG